MSLIKLTFDGASNSAKNDANYFHFLLSKENGIFKDYLGGAVATSLNGTITFKEGIISAYGRRVYVEENTSISVPLNASKKGYVVAVIDTATNEVTLAYKEGTDSAYPSLTQTDLSKEDGIYELVLCSYEKTTSSLTLGTENVSYILTTQDVYNRYKKEIETELASFQQGIACKYKTYTSYSNNTYTFDISDCQYENGFISFFFCQNCFTFSFDLLKSTSVLAFTYRYINNDYLGMIERSGNRLYITVAESTHKIRCIYVYY